jgi:hypothetical protein
VIAEVDGTRPGVEGQITGTDNPIVPAIPTVKLQRWFRFVQTFFYKPSGHPCSLSNGIDHAPSGFEQTHSFIVSHVHAYFFENRQRISMNVFDVTRGKQLQQLSLENGRAGHRLSLIH